MIVRDTFKALVENGPRSYMMSTYVETNCETKGFSTGIHCPAKTNTESDIGKKKWIQRYSRRLLRLWLQWQTPLGVACAYTEQIKKDLATFYEDPLKRMFIETTYC
jgi:hypothetical protein